MLHSHATLPLPHKEEGGKKMEKLPETSAIETSKLSLIPLGPAKPCKRVSFDLSDTRDRRDTEKNVTTSAKDAVPTGNTRDLEAAREAVVFMGLPDALVQLVIDMEQRDLAFRFSNGEQLYLLACQLLDNPARQAELFKKCYATHDQQASPVSSDSRVDSGVTGTAPVNAEGDGQQPLAGMSEGSRQSSAATTSSSTTSSSSTSSSASSSSAAVAPGCCSPEMVAASGRSEGGCASLPKIMPSAAPSSTKTRERVLETPVFKHIEENAEQNLAKDATEDPKSDIPGTSSEDTTALSNAATEPKPETPQASSTEQLRERVKNLARENWRLSQRKLCRACRTVELSSSGVTFLPCGHFITCEACSEKFDDCPACGKTIMGTVRTFLS